MVVRKRDGDEFCDSLGTPVTQRELQNRRGTVGGGAGTRAQMNSQFSGNEKQVSSWKLRLPREKGEEKTENTPA